MAITEKELLEIRRLKNKYRDEGLIIDITLDDNGLIFRGTWGRLRLRRLYDYYLMENTVMDLERLIDSFYYEFKEKLDKYEKQEKVVERR